MASSWSRTLKNLALFSSWAKEKNFPTCKQWLFRLCPKGAHQSNWHKRAWADSQNSDKISFIPPFKCHCIEIPEGLTFEGQGTKPKPSVTMSWTHICQSRTAVKQHIRYAQLTAKSCHESRPMQDMLSLWCTGCRTAPRHRLHPKGPDGATSPTEGRVFSLEKPGRRAAILPRTHMYISKLLFPTTSSYICSLNSKATAIPTSQLSNQPQGVSVQLWRHTAPLHRHFGWDPSITSRYLHPTWPSGLPSDQGR